MSNKTKILLPLLVVAFGIAAGALIIRTRPEAERQQADAPDPVVRVIEANPTRVTLTVPSQGSVRPRTESTLVAQVKGEIVEVGRSFAEGGFFEQGDLLLRIDPSDYKLGVSRAQAELAQARLRLDQEEAQAEVAREEWAELGNGEPNPLALREPQLAQAQAAVSAAESALNQAELDLRRTEIRAPYDGRVRAKLADLGQFVRDGTQLASLFAIDVAEVRLPIPQDQLAFLDIPLSGVREETGPPVALSANLGGRPIQWSGRIVRSAGELDQRSRMFNLIAEVDDPYRRHSGEGAILPAGLFVDAQIEGRTIDQVIPLPRTALRDRSRVLVLESGNRLRFRPVEVLRVQDETALITGGLEPGELVCISALDAVVDGMRVEPLREDVAETVEES
jgi:RND family efflux transporter MFP subunit